MATVLITGATGFLGGYAVRELLAAGRVGLGAFAGFIIGTAAKLGCALSIVFVLLGVYLFSLL